MAQAYCKVLKAMEVPFVTFCRSTETAERFLAETRVQALTSPFEEYTDVSTGSKRAIVAVSNDQLYGVALRLLRAGVKEILLEKPGGISAAEISHIASLAFDSNAKVFIAFNRRFYASTLKALKIIEADGGPTSCVFYFTEWLNSIPSYYSDDVYRTWLLSNPIHVLDLFIKICGRPTNWKCLRSGSIEWHPNGAIFTGTGETDKGVLFSYHADWGSAGRWNLEVYTQKRKLILCPMETLQEVVKHTIDITPIEIDDEHDRRFKPGLFKQVEAFLSGQHGEFCTIEQQKENFTWYYEIAGY
jgi:predicted dehydrogenase